MNISKMILGCCAVLLIAGNAKSADLINHYRASNLAGAEAPPNYGLRLDGFYDGIAASVVTFSLDNVFIDEFSDNTIRLSGTVSVVKSTSSGNGGNSGGDDFDDEDDDDKGEQHDNDGDDFDDSDENEGNHHGGEQFIGTKYFLEVTMKQVTDPDSIATISNYNPSWKYYTIQSDGLELENVIDTGDHARLWSYPIDGTKPFQIGDGANGKNNNFGASGWISFEHVIGSMIFGNTANGHFRSSDFLMDLSQVTDVNDNNPIAGLPAGFELRGNYPNPFNPSTTIDYSLPNRTHVSIKIYNVMGQLVRELINADQSAGDHLVTWDGKDKAGSTVPTGIYFYRVQTDSFAESRKMLLLK